MKYLVVLLLMVSACAKKNDVSIQTIQGDPLRASMPWASSSPWWATNLDPSVMGDQIIHWVLAYDQECQSAVQLDNSGNMKIAFSLQLSKAQVTDLPCSYFDGTWTYSLSGKHLTICPAGGPCVVF